ncbi:hypothetical protein [Pseudoalteromonas denitrificans]|jgi:hypothetical protein|uniref:Uncharacterized protein n=1 Tax=Pseudoalteromonas denitrificans DSM 6059 TaxID=1123010 RepID=A0A1I1RK33_9GAMM|nr:hypothetical protein [Pseudoalteromonas denitrificans]SFD34502.1 hypothetical protein SAMN02745724_04260 [Pseudoalteromonas denitrificans DSM 6059]
MKLKLNKKKLKNLSKDSNSLPLGMTPHVGGGKNYSDNCESDLYCQSVDICYTQKSPNGPCIIW